MNLGVRMVVGTRQPLTAELTYVVPSVLQPLIEMNRPLPWPTRVVKGTSDFLIQRGWIIVIAIVGVVLTELVMWLERRMSRWRQLERERF